MAADRGLMWKQIQGNRIRCTSTDMRDILNWMANQEHLTRAMARMIQNNHHCDSGMILSDAVDQWYREQIEREDTNGCRQSA